MAGYGGIWRDIWRDGPGRVGKLRGAMWGGTYIGSKPRVRRTQKKNSTKLVNLFYSNINGFKGKSLSLQAVLQKLQPMIVVLCEIKLGNIAPVKEAIFNMT